MSPRNNYPRASYGGRGNCWVIVLKRRARTLPTNTPVGAGINSTVKHNRPTRRHWPDSTGQTVLVRQHRSPGGGQTVLVRQYWSDSLGLGVLARQYWSDSAGHTVRGHGPAVPEGHKVLAVVDHPPPVRARFGARSASATGGAAAPSSHSFPAQAAQTAQACNSDASNPCVAKK